MKLNFYLETFLHPPRIFLGFWGQASIFSFWGQPSIIDESNKVFIKGKIMPRNSRIQYEVLFN